MAFEFFSEAEVLNDQSKSLKDSVIMHSCGRVSSQPQAGFSSLYIPPNPDQRQGLEGEKRWGWEEGEEKILYSGFVPGCRVE